jgi:hypothetical protein
MKLNRYLAGLLKSNEGDICWSEDVARLGASHEQMLEVLKELQECSEYWSEYFVPLGIHDRIKNAIKAAEDIE